MSETRRRDERRVSAVLDRLAVLEKQRAMIDAEQVALLAELDAMPGAGSDPANAKNYVHEEVACALRWSTNLAASRMHTARTLVDRLPRTLAMLASGAISLRHAQEVADVAVDVDASLVAEFERHVLVRAGEQTPAELRRTVRHTVKILDPRGDLERHVAALLERRVCLQPDDHGMCWLISYLPADGAQIVWLAVQTAADTMPPDGRSADQRRADALVAICAGYLDGTTALQHGHRPTIQVTVALSTLHALDEQPGELAGHGPIPAAMARRIAADPTGTWHRLVTDPLGRLIDHGRARYSPPADLRDHVLAHDSVCTRPGCQRPAARCQIDHHTAWVDGGTTNADNLGPACPRDHHAKHETGWSVRRRRDGTVRWTSPTGRHYDKPPTRHPIDTTTTTNATASENDPPPF